MESPLEWSRNSPFFPLSTFYPFFYFSLGFLGSLSLSLSLPKCLAFILSGFYGRYWRWLLLSVSLFLYAVLSHHHLNLKIGNIALLSLKIWLMSHSKCLSFPIMLCLELEENGRKEEKGNGRKLGRKRKENYTLCTILDIFHFLSSYSPNQTIKKNFFNFFFLSFLFHKFKTNH